MLDRIDKHVRNKEKSSRPVSTLTLLLGYFARFFGCFCLDDGPSHGLRGVRGVMVIVVGNGHDDTSSNPGRD